MGMLLTSNSTSNALTRPDGFNPPFSLEGCEYIGLYDKDPATNFAPGKIQPSIIGTLVRDGVGIKTKSSVDYIDTNIIPGTSDMTIITVVDKSSAKAKVGEAQGRVWLVSSYSGSAGGDVGASLSLEGRDATTGAPITISTYRSVSVDGTPTRDVVTAMGSVQGSTDFGIYVGRHWTEGSDVKASVLNLRNEGSAGNTAAGKKFATTSNTLKVGSATSTVPDPAASTVTIYCTMIFKRNLATDELRTIRAWLYDYYRRRGIQGV